MENILPKETKEKFGYTLDKLRPNSQKLVIWKCISCGEKKEKQFRSAKINKLCLKCSNKVNANTNRDIRGQKIKEAQKKKGHPRLGIKHTEESRRKMSESKKGKPLSESTKKKLSLLFSGEGNPFYGKKHSKESLEKMSEIQKRTTRKGKDCNFYGKQYHGKGDYYKDIWMRSSWEIKFAQYLDEKGIGWQYEKERFPITYEYQGEIKEGTYCPDFYIEKEDCFYEVKGFWRDDAKEKYEAFTEQYPDVNIKLYEKSELQKIISI